MCCNEFDLRRDVAKRIFEKPFQFVALVGTLFWLRCRQQYSSLRRSCTSAVGGFSWAFLAKSFVRHGGLALTFWPHLGAYMNATLFFSGIAMATFGASGVFFLKFWKASHDRFFLFFAVACWLLSFERVVSLFVNGTLSDVSPAELDASSWVYLIRLLAFAMILIAIVEKNRKAKK
jgi:hypothetical protein